MCFEQVFPSCNYLSVWHTSVVLELSRQKDQEFKASLSHMSSYLKKKKIGFQHSGLWHSELYFFFFRITALPQAPAGNVASQLNRLNQEGDKSVIEGHPLFHLGFEDTLSCKPFTPLFPKNSKWRVCKMAPGFVSHGAWGATPSRPSCEAGTLPAEVSPQPHHSGLLHK